VSKKKVVVSTLCIKKHLVETILIRGDKILTLKVKVHDYIMTLTTILVLLFSEHFYVFAQD
ncbi:hypothetical protein MTR67_018450, partial [Solanum verrucosum]